MLWLSMRLGLANMAAIAAIAFLPFVAGVTSAMKPAQNRHAAAPQIAGDETSADRDQASHDGAARAAF